MINFLMGAVFGALAVIVLICAIRMAIKDRDGKE